MEPWLRRAPQPAKLFCVILMVVLASMGIVTIGVWIWAILFRAMEIFSYLEETVYYSLVAYATLAFGNDLMPQSQRLPGA